MTIDAVASTSLRLRTHAKLNLFLRVAGKRADGFHEIESVFHGIKLADEIDVVELPDSGRVEVVMDLGDEVQGDVPPLEENLVWRAARAVQDRARVRRGVRITLTKHIPLGAGLGGGSGNAAGVIVALDRLWDLGQDRGDLLTLGAVVGSDVPYCIAGGTALATSRGDELTPLPAMTEMWFVIGLMHEPLFTRDVYAAWDAVASGRGAASAPMVLAVGAGDIHEIAALLHNDLEEAAFTLRPELAAKKRALLEAGALGASLSGSGPALFGIATDEAHAAVVAKEVEGEFDRVVVVPTQPRCTEFLQ